jgi:glycerophosphoryl diester phosphodiesterase
MPDAGRWFDERFEGELLPLLEEVFDLTPSEVLINVEIKAPCGRGIEAALVALMRRKNRVNNVVVSSFDHKSLAIVKLMEAQAQIGLLYDCNPVRHSAFAVTAGIPLYALHPRFKRLGKEDVHDILGY